MSSSVSFNCLSLGNSLSPSVSPPGRFRSLESKGEKSLLFRALSVNKEDDTGPNRAPTPIPFANPEANPKNDLQSFHRARLASDPKTPPSLRRVLTVLVANEKGLSDEQEGKRCSRGLTGGEQLQLKKQMKEKNLDANSESVFWVDPGDLCEEGEGGRFFNLKTQSDLSVSLHPPDSRLKGAGNSQPQVKAGQAPFTA